MKKLLILMFTAAVLFSFTACREGPSPGGEPNNNETSEEPASKLDSLEFEADQLYAAAYLGYQEIEDLAHYAEKYLDSDNIPIHYFSDGEYYLIIPRYDGMEVTLYRNSIETGEKTKVYEASECTPFIIKCNISDIFPDVTVELGYIGETVEFSPYISLMDGSVQVGERGLDITKKQ